MNTKYFIPIPFVRIIYLHGLSPVPILVDFKDFDLRDVQRGMLHVAKKHIGEPPQGLSEDFTGRHIRQRYIKYDEQRSIIDSEELEILTELQHYGGTTNLIDFTTDYLIALFSHAPVS